MSTGLECVLFEDADGRWFYVLQRGDCPVDAYDWFDYADVHGSFPSQEQAKRHLQRQYANPGGYDVARHNPRTWKWFAPLVSRARL